MKAKKVIALALAAVLLVCASVAATVAYLTDTESVNNTFTVGQIGISLDEAKVDVYGAKELDANKKEIRVTEGNAYKLIPGHTYVKDPTVTVDANSEESYVRMIVTITDIANVKSAFGVTSGYFYPQNFVLDENGNTTWDAAKWPCVKIEEKDGKATYEFRYHTTVSTLDTDTTDDVPAQALPLEPLFSKFTVPSSIIGANLDKLGNMQILVEAHAMQADGFADANAAWTAFTA